MKTPTTGNPGDAKVAKMTFSGYYKRLPNERPRPPKTAFVLEIAELCKVSTQTVRMWIAGVQRPDALKQSLIENRLGIPAEELFPQNFE